MVARIYKPAKTAMQSGTAKTKDWILDYEPEEPRDIEPLMGWTASGDMLQQVRLRFDSAEEAIAFCKRYEILYQVFHPKPDTPRIIPYADNFSEFSGPVNFRAPSMHYERTPRFRRLKRRMALTALQTQEG